MSGASRISKTLLTGLVAVVFLVGLNVAAVRLNMKADLTPDKRNTLAPETVAALKNLKVPVQALGFFRPEEETRSRTEDLLKLFVRETDKFSYEFLDPDKALSTARDLGVSQTGTLVVKAGDKSERVTFADEQKLLNALVRTTSAKGGRIGFTAGHGEIDLDGSGGDPAGVLKKFLADQGVAVEKVLLGRSPEIAADLDALLILGPKKDFLEPELAALKTYLGKGGRVLVAYHAEARTNLEGLVAESLGVARKPGMIIDLMGYANLNEPLIAMVTAYNDQHPIVRDFLQTTLFPTATALEPAKPGPEGLAVDVLATSPQDSFQKTNPEALKTGKVDFDKASDVMGPLWLAAAVEAKKNPAAAPATPDEPKKTGQRAVVVGDQDFLTDKFINVAANLDFVQNTMKWLLEREELIAVSKPKAASQFLLMSAPQRLMLLVVPLFLLPGGVLAYGVFAAIRRKRPGKDGGKAA